MHEQQGPELGNESQEPLQHAPRIYVASLSDYNAGRLHGAWVEAHADAQGMAAAIAEMLATSPEPHAEEWAIHDCEGFGSLELGEFESLDTIAALAAGVAEHGPAYAQWVRLVGFETADPEGFVESFLGEWPSMEAFAEELILDLGIIQEVERVIPTSMRSYVKFDIEAFAHDLELGGEVSVVERREGGVWIFRE